MCESERDLLSGNNGNQKGRMLEERREGETETIRGRGEERQGRDAAVREKAAALSAVDYSSSTTAHR